MQRYTDEQIFDRLREHLIENLGSVHTLYKPSWQAVLKRMAKSEEFADRVKDIVNEANLKWERIGIDALLERDERFNVNLYKWLTQNKKSFLTHEVLELEKRIQELEERQNG